MSTTSIRNRLLWIFLLVSILPLLLLGSYGFYSRYTDAQAEATASQENRVKQAEEHISSFLQSVADDLFYLRDSSAMGLYLSALVAGDQKSQELMLKNLESSLFDFSDKKKIYHQVRFIDKTGQEVVRVDHPINSSKLIPANQLQNKKGRYYFDEAIALPREGLFISPLDLNREQGKVELPIRPTIRYATPVFDANKELRGIVILNVSATNLLKLLTTQGNQQASRMMFIDQAGFYYYHPDENRAWGSKNDLDSGNNFYQDYPALVDGVEKHIRLSSFTNASNLISLQPVMVGNGHQKLGTLISMTTTGSIFANAWQFALVAVALMVLLIPLAVLLSKWLARTLCQDTQP